MFIYIGVGVVKGRASSALAQERAKGKVTKTTETTETAKTAKTAKTTETANAVRLERCR